MKQASLLSYSVIYALITIIGLAIDNLKAAIVTFWHLLCSPIAFIWLGHNKARPIIQRILRAELKFWHIKSMECWAVCTGPFILSIASWAVCSGQFMLSIQCWTVCTGHLCWVFHARLFVLDHFMLSIACWVVRNAQCPMLRCLFWAIHAEYPTLDRACWPYVPSYTFWAVHAGSSMLRYLYKATLIVLSMVGHIYWVVSTGSFLLAVCTGFKCECILSHLCWAIHNDPSLSELCSCWAAAINALMSLPCWISVVDICAWTSCLSCPYWAVHAGLSMLGCTNWV